MSVVSSNSSILSILKASNARRSTLNQPRLRLPTNIKEIFKKYNADSNLQVYVDLIGKIKDTEITDLEFIYLLKEARSSIQFLSSDLKLFVQALNIIKWCNRKDEVVQAYQLFINDLVSAHSQHTKVVIDGLIKLFLNIEDSQWSDCEPAEQQKKEFENVHEVLKSVTEKIPMSEYILLECLNNNFPFYLGRLSTAPELSYVYNTLKIISYRPHLRLNILQMIIDKLVLRDVHAPRDDIIQAEDQQGDLLYEMEVDEGLPQAMKHPIAAALDGMMELLFQFIKNECFEGEKLIKVKCHKLYNELLCIFENVILPTQSTHHIQFIIFYICSFESTLAHQFLKYLWTKATSPDLPPVIRQTCILYLSSFLARANYVLLGYIKNYLSKICEWVHNYIANCSDNTNVDMDFTQHCVFHSMCQAVFYLIAFRHQDLMDSRYKLTFLQSLNLSNIVTCKLNPLRVCQANVVKNFAAVTRAHQLAYCYTIIENNMRNQLPIVDRDGTVKHSPNLEAYFPFDPYILQRTNRFIKPLYGEYDPIAIEDLSPTGDMKTKQHSQSPFYREGFSPVNMSCQSFEN